MLSSIEFRLTVNQSGREFVEPWVNGASLVSLVSDFETKQGYVPSGAYGGIAASGGVERIYAYLRREQDDAWPSRGKAWLLGCECGEAGCWPLEAIASCDGGTVTWSKFSQPYRPEWSYEEFGELVFDRAEYDAAIAAALAILEAGKA